MPAKRPTIDDVAREAGVSKATVSAVINDTGSVKDATRNRVLQVIQDLNYRPSGLAKRTGAQKSRSIGLLIKEIDNPYYSEMVASARKHAHDHGYTLLVASSEGEYQAERQIVELLRAKDVDGLLINPVLDENTDLSHLFELKRRNFPFVLLEEIRGVQASLVDIDNVEVTRKAVRYLIDVGHRQIVHFAGPRYSMRSEQRIEGVRRAYSESSLIFTEDLIVPAGASCEDGYRAGLDYFRATNGPDRPTAVLCYNDLVALGLLRALSERGIQVPGDVSVVGYDDIEILRYLPMSLTTISLPKREIAEKAIHLLVQQIEAREPVPPEKIFFDAELVIRGSTRSLHTDPLTPRLDFDVVQRSEGVREAEMTSA